MDEDRPVIPKTTITAFGPILPTNVSLPERWGGQFSSHFDCGPIMAESLPVLHQPMLGIPSLPVTTFNSPLSQPAAIMPSASEYIPQMSVGQLSFAAVPQSVNMLCSPVLYRPQSSSVQKMSPPPSMQKTNPRLVMQATTSQLKGGDIQYVYSPLKNDCNEAPNDAPLKASFGHSPAKPASVRRVEKQADLEQVENFLKESKMNHERIYANFLDAKIQPVVARDERLSASIRALTDANNVAELRRTIATRYQETPKVDMQAPKLDIQTSVVEKPPLQAPIVEKRPQQAHQVEKPPAHISTQEATHASPARHVSGVFVSYPRKASVQIEQPEASWSPNGASMIGKRPGEKMTATEFITLRQNLLERSEQHAVTTPPTRSTKFPRA